MAESTSSVAIVALPVKEPYAIRALSDRLYYTARRVSREWLNCHNCSCASQSQ
jgi:hypothetical protein